MTSRRHLNTTACSPISRVYAPHALSEQAPSALYLRRLSDGGAPRLDESVALRAGGGLSWKSGVSRARTAPSGRSYDAERDGERGRLLSVGVGDAGDGMGDDARRVGVCGAMRPSEARRCARGRRRGR